MTIEGADRGETVTLLAHAAATFANQPAAALAQLLAAWRLQPAPALADAVDRVAARVEAQLEPLGGDSVEARCDRWTEVATAARPEDLGRLVDALFNFKSAGETTRRLALLADWPAHPRLASHLVQLLAAPPYGATSTQPFWQTLLAIVAAIADVRTLAALTGEHAGWKKAINDVAMRRWLAERVAETAAAIRAQHEPGDDPALSPAEMAQLAQLTAQLGDDAAEAARATLRGLYEAVYAAPHEDGPRLVVADWLLERNDPRGELITLQYARLAGNQRKADQQREQELLRLHRHTWLGPLAPLFSYDDERWADLAAGFERGFFNRCVISTQDPALLPLFADPSWATVDELHLATELPVLTAAMRGLRTVSGVRLRELLARHPPSLPIEALSCDGPSVDEREEHFSESEVAALAQCGFLPRLKRLRFEGAPWHRHLLDVPPSDLRPLWPAPLGAQLEELALPTGLRSVAAWLAEAPRLGASLKTLRILCEPTVRWSGSGLQLLLERGSDGKLSALRMRLPQRVACAFEDLMSLLEALPTDALTGFSLVPSKIQHPNRKQLERLERAAQRQTRLAKLELPPVLMPDVPPA